MNTPIPQRPQPGKRAIDFTLALFGIIVLSPVIVCTWILARIGMGLPVIFRQTRPGLGGRPFELMKFRTMTDARDADGRLKPDVERLTLAGRFLRKTSLDELPQLFNVLRGDMSLVGPRPLLMEYLPNYSDEQNRRHSVRPGITGWSQVNGRNNVVFSERLKLDVWYVDHWSPWLDIKILALTALRVVRSSGVRFEQTLDEVDDVGLHPESAKAKERARIARSAVHHHAI